MTTMRTLESGVSGGAIWRGERDGGCGGERHGQAGSRALPPLRRRIGPPARLPGLFGWFSQPERPPPAQGGAGRGVWGSGGGVSGVCPRWGNTTLIEALANRESCLMCWPFLPMMAPTACAGMKTCTVSCSGGCGYSVPVQGSASPFRAQHHHGDQG